MEHELKQTYKGWLGLLLLCVLMSACYRPPYNQFEPPQTLFTHTVVGAGVGAIAGTAAGAPVLGTGIGLASGAVVGLLKTSRPYLIKKMKAHDIQLVEYGDTITLVVPTDRYYVFNRPQLHELQYPGLEAMLNFIRLYPKAMFAVVGFSDNVGSRRVNTQLASARAHTMVTFLYANGFSSKQLFAESFGPRYAIGDQTLVHGAAYNRRIEIQWHQGGCLVGDACSMPDKANWKQ